MPICFYSAKSQRDKEKGRTTGHVMFEDGLQDFLLAVSDRINFDIKVILDLDPYGDALLGSSCIQELMTVSGRLKNHNVLVEYKRYDSAVQSLIELENLCHLALDNHNYIWAMGD